jgi:2,3-dihydroxybiphenyl 1,2-dioxygenase
MSTDLKLGYLGFEVKEPKTWESFATDVLGLGIGERGADGSLTLRMDDYAARFLIRPGPSDDLFVIGWEAPDRATLEQLAERARKAGVEVAAGSAEEAAQRNVEHLVKLADPGGIPLELFTGPKRGNAFRSSVVRSGFVTGTQGMGHAVISAEAQQESQSFYVDVLGFRLSDRIVCEVFGYKVDIAFFHTNSRHHSVAFGNRQKKRIHHFMIEVGAFDDVGLAMDRALKAGVPIVQTLGRHPNDRMFSFYAKTPSGFQFEFGWGGREVDDATWQPTTYDHISEWGHHPPQVLTGQLRPAR